MAVVDLAKVRREASAMGVLLRRHGLPTDVNEAMKMLAKMVVRDHKHLRTLLTSCKPEERHNFYEALRPNLSFIPKPLDVYIAEAGQMAEREKLPQVDAEGKLHEFSPAQDIASAEKAIANAIAEKILTLICSKCLTEEQFPQVGMETAVDVRVKALKAGWILVPDVICPRCPSLWRPNA